MSAALIGDLIGSAYEGTTEQRKDFEPLIHPCVQLPDDTVLTYAVVEALLEGERGEAIARRFRRRVGRDPRCGRGQRQRFAERLCSSSLLPCGSLGNGPAAHGTPAALLARSRDKAVDLARATAEAAPDYPEGIRGAPAAAIAIYRALQGEAPAAIRREAVAFSGYDLSLSVDQIRPGCTFEANCRSTVPQALACALEARDFEDAIRNAVSIGGDTDRLAAIAEPVAEALFGIPPAPAQEVEARLPADMREAIERLYERAGRPSPRHRQAAHQP